MIVLSSGLFSGPTSYGRLPIFFDEYEIGNHFPASNLAEGLPINAADLLAALQSVACLSALQISQASEYP